MVLRAAEKVSAMLTLALWLERAGQEQEAEDWYRRAAETGNPNAMLTLAMWLERTGEPEAEEWFRRAGKLW